MTPSPGSAQDRDGAGSDPARSDPARSDTADGEATRGDGPARFVPPALLTDLLASGLDGGYADAARRRAERAAARAVDGPTAGPAHADHRFGAARFRAGAVLLTVAAGFVVALGWNESHRAAPDQAVLREQLVQRVRAAQSAVAGLQGQATAAAADVASLQSAALAGNDQGRAVQSQVARGQIAAGGVAVSGLGLQITLGDPSVPDTAAPGGRPGSTPQAQVRLIGDGDMRDLINVLWSAGAEAIAVDQVRITPLSAIRVAGEDILIDFQVVTSPYTVAAIGPADALSIAFADSPIASRLNALKSNRGLQFTFTDKSTLTLPAGVIGALDYASAIPSAAPMSTAAPSSSADSTPAPSGAPS